MVKNLPARQETQVGFLGRVDPLEKEIILAWRIPWTEMGYSQWGHKELDMTERLILTHLVPV